VIYYNQKEGEQKQVKELIKMTNQERKIKARGIVEQYFNEAKWWIDNVGKEDSRAITCCSRFAVAVEMYEVLTGEKYN
jgi:hypothetical protein